MVELAVTVDDLPATGAHPGGTTRLEIARQMIQALTRHGVPGVYGFVNGHNLQDAPQLGSILRAWSEAGLLFGNHTFSHMDLLRVSAVEFIADIERNERVLASLFPPDAAKYFRYPYLSEGDTVEKRDAVRQWLIVNGYTNAPVTVNLRDWEWNAAYVRCAAIGDWRAITRLQNLFIEAAMAQLAWSKEVSARLFKRQVKHILLLHVGAFAALMLDELLGAFRAAGVRLIGLDAAVQDPAYQINPGLVGSEECTFLMGVAEDWSVEVPPFPAGPPELSGLPWKERMIPRMIRAAKFLWNIPQ
jgi:peptidoglycan-N-acetylglucosamine deacetylase